MQILALFVNMVVCYLLLARTWFFEAGLFGLIVSKFKWLLLVSIVNFLFVGGMRAAFIVRILSGLGSDGLDWAGAGLRGQPGFGLNLLCGCSHDAGRLLALPVSLMAWRRRATGAG